MCLSIYVVPGHPDRDKPGRLRTELKGIADKIIILDDYQVGQAAKKCETDWYMYLHADEYLPHVIRAVIPVYLQFKQHDAFVMYTLFKEEGKYVTGRAPRLFQSHVELKEDLLPIGKISYSIMLDGYIFRRVDLYDRDRLKGNGKKAESS